MSSVSSSEIKREFVKSKIGLIGIGILASLIILSMIASYHNSYRHIQAME